MGIESRESEVSILFPIMIRVSQMALVAVLVCSAVACMTTHKTEAERLADNATVERVQAALSADRNLFSRHITIRADGGVVTLGGYVWTPEELLLARADTQSVSGVSQVVDRMEVDRGAVNDSNVTR